MKSHTILLLALLAAGLAPASGAGEQDSTLLSLDRIFSSREFFSRGAPPFQWLEGGQAYTTLERPAGGGSGREIVRYETQTGQRTVIVNTARLTPGGATEPLSVEHYEWSPDGGHLLVFTNSKRVWRTNTRGDYWVLDVRAWKLTRLGGDAPASTLMFAKVFTRRLPRRLCQGEQSVTSRTSRHARGSSP
jgi:hypothetical protein